jgi:cell division protein FtsI (penicillin-binding protein 3)
MKKSRLKAFQMRGERGSALDLARGRIVILSGVFAIAFIVVAARVVDLSVIQGVPKTPVTAEDYAAALEPQEGQGIRRADIVDRNGVLLARSLKTASLYADPKMIADPERVAKDVVSALPGIKYGDVLKKLQDSSRFVWIKRNLTPQEQSDILYLGHPGLGFKSEDRRVYPQGALPVHIVGYASIDEKGLAGVEASFDKLLKQGGEPLALTLDIRLQHALRKEMLAALKKHSARGAAGIILDVENGDVLASVSLPDYDPNDFRDVSDEQRFNNVTLGLYEHGSTFKIFSVAAYIESTKNALSRSFDAREPLKAGRGRMIRDFHPQKRVLTLPEVFVHSSNIGTALMAQEMGTETLLGFYRDIGLIGRPEIEIPEAARSTLHDPWYEVDTLSASFGHAVATSPLQLAAATASIINGGTLVQPTVILNRTPEQTREKIRVASPETAHRMRQLMRLVVTEGTGEKADVPGLGVGGKTGTAEKPGRGGYNRSSLLSSFIGVFPIDAPRYAVLVMLDEPQATKDTYGYATGGWVAAPVVKNVIAAIAVHTGMAPQDADSGMESPLRRYVRTEEQIRQERDAQTH